MSYDPVFNPAPPPPPDPVRDALERKSIDDWRAWRERKDAEQERARRDRAQQFA